MDFLRAAVRMCPNVACVLTKTDLYPQWRRIAELDRGHLAAADVAADLIPVSSAVRQVALQTKSKSLNEESGFPVLIRYLREEVLARADQLDRRNTANDVLEVRAQLTTTLQAELTAQESPERAAALVAELERAQAAATRLKDRTARWQITLNDGVADLVADVEHDLRDRLRRITREGEELVDAADPALVWDQFSAWVHREVCVAASRPSCGPRNGRATSPGGWRAPPRTAPSPCPSWSRCPGRTPRGEHDESPGDRSRAWGTGHWPRCAGATWAG